MSSSVNYQHQPRDAPPSYNDIYHQEGTVGGKPVYVQGPPPPPPPPPPYPIPTTTTHYQATQQHVVLTQPQTHYVVPVTEVTVGPGRCPACRVGILTTNYTFLGILCCIFFFPLGMICCLLLTERRCSYCRLRYD